jgi:small subunit ribosomal protein S16
MAQFEIVNLKFEFNDETFDPGRIYPSREDTLPVKIRLRRMGAKKHPFYRIVVANSTSPRDGRFIDTLGHYDPCTEPPTVKVDAEKAKRWLSNGAQPTEIARALLKKEGILDKPAETPSSEKKGK